jgi:hypothetical protein
VSTGCRAPFGVTDSGHEDLNPHRRTSPVSTRDCQSCRLALVPLVHERPRGRRAAMHTWDDDDRRSDPSVVLHMRPILRQSAATSSAPARAKGEGDRQAGVLPITSCSWNLLGRARRCWPGGSPPCCRRSPWPKTSRPPTSIASPSSHAHDLRSSATMLAIEARRTSAGDDRKPFEREKPS